MKKLIFLAFLVAIALILAMSDSVIGGRRGGGGGGGRGGGIGASRPVGGAPSIPMAAGLSAARHQSSGPLAAPDRRRAAAARYTTKGGSTIDYKGAAMGGTTAGGVQGGQYVGGIQVTTPGGQRSHQGRHRRRRRGARRQCDRGQIRRHRRLGTGRRVLPADIKAASPSDRKVA